MQPEITIIVPVFNGERTLVKALNSIAEQSFSNFECLIINDGSTDGTETLMAAYSQSDPRFRPITIPNGGVSHAKNVGLSNAQGNFWMFLDCDDTLELYALDTLYTLITQTHADIAIGHIAIEDGTGALVPQSPPIPESIKNPWCMDSETAVETMFKGQPFGGHLHGKLLRAKPLQSLRYQEDIFIYEDMLFLMDALPLCQKIAYTPVIVHHYLTEGGAFSGCLNCRKTSSLRACQRLTALSQLNFPKAVPAAKAFAFQNALSLLEELARADSDIRSPSWAKTARKEACRIIQCSPMPANMPTVQKLFCHAVRLGWRTFYLLYKGPYLFLKRWF